MKMKELRMRQIKHKSHSHKEENAFKFETFNEKLNKINVSSLNNLKRRLIDNEEVENISYFAATLEKWADLNCTNDFRSLRFKLGSPLDFQNLVQIIHKKKFLTKILLKEIENHENKALDAVLELLVALCRDLQSEFYEFFRELFDLLVDLSIKCINPEIIEYVFVCQTFLFKYLCKFIIKDIEKHWNIFKKALLCSKEYIVNFTSEIFAFLMRRCKEPEKLIEMIFMSVEGEEKLSLPVGQIIFQTIKGLNGNINNKADCFLKICFQQLNVSNRYHSLNVMKNFINFCLINLNQNAFGAIWNFVLVDSNDITIINRLVTLIHQIVHFKKCNYVISSLKLLNKCLTLLCEHEIDQKTKQNLLQILEKIFLYKYEDLYSDKMNDFCQKFFSCNRLLLQDLLNFTSKIISSPLYDKVLYKYLNRLFFEVMTKKEDSEKLIAIEFMSSSITKKRPRPKYGKEINKVTKLMLEFDDNQSIVEQLCKTITHCDDFQIIYHCLIILSNLSSSDLSDFIESNIISSIEIYLTEKCETSHNIFPKLLFETVIFLILQKSYNSLITEFNVEMFIKFLTANPCRLEILQSLDLFITYNKSISNEDNYQNPNGFFAKLYPFLEMNVSSPYRMNRIVALHILTLFECTLPRSSLEENSDCLTIFQICLDAELIPVDLNNYRERLRLISKLDCNFVSVFIPESISGIQFDLLPVYFLLGTLYENLSLLWKPVVDILETYAKSTKDQNGFLNVILNHFQKTQSLIQAFDSNNLNTKEIFENDIATSPDHQNHRLWLLKSFDRFPTIVERRNSQFVNLFFNFLSLEFIQGYIDRDMSRENIMINSSELESDPNDVSPKNNSKMIWKTFFAYLEVFEKFKNPKAVHKEPELLKIYLDLLSSPNSIAQKHALNCLSTYNHPYLLKYKENFLKLIDDNSFTSEINSFMVHDNAEDNVVAVEDRSNVTNIFLRILIGKMIASSGTKTHGKSKADFTRSLIFKVLSSYDEDTQIMFMDLIYSSLNTFINADYQTLVFKISNSIDLKSFIPFKRFQSFVTTLEFLMKHFGNTSVRVMQYMLKILIICSHICCYLLSSNYRSRIKDYIIESLKTFRTNCFKTAEYFFYNFHKYQFTSIEIDLLFESLVQPLVVNLHSESLNQPSPLLRLFNVWAQNPRYFILLVKHIEPVENFTPISAIVKLYSNQKLSKSTYLFITKLIENLLVGDSDREEPVQDISINNFDFVIPSCKQYQLDEEKKIGLGSVILIPYTREIINSIESNRSFKSTNSKLSIEEVNILARLSLWVTDPIDSKKIMVLLLSSISKNKRPEEEKEIFILKILSHLSKNIEKENFYEILKQAFDLFSLIDKPLPRKELCNFLVNLSKKNQSFLEMAIIICKLNSFNPRFPEEPDYDLRISTFKNVSGYFETIDCSSLSETYLEFIQLLLLNCSFFINTYDDMSLRELSSMIIIKICTLFQNAPIELFNKFVVELVLFKIVSQGIHYNKENASSEFINILIQIIETFPSKNNFIDQLSSLSNEDEEVDFWQNIKHIQIHRRVRALNRLLHNKELLCSISGRIYSSFLIPIVLNFISQSTPANKNYNIPLLNVSVDSLATFLQYCSWIKYDQILTYYINSLLQNKIETKIAIRIVSALLEKFSFLKPEQILMVERSFNSNDFETIRSEYDIIYESKVTNRMKNNKNRKSHKKPNNEIHGKNEDEYDGKQSESDKLDSEKNIISAQSENDLRYYKKIYDSLCRKLLPMLHRCLHKRFEMENVHDSIKYDYADDEEIQIIPIGVAIVKLLKHVQLNQKILEINLNSVILRLCQFLQSKAFSIRETARKTLAQIIEILGPKYFANIFYEMKTLLNRGYQRHVLIYTIHVLIQRLIPQLNAGDLDDCMLDLIEVCHQELFGMLGEEKEVSQIVTKTKEAKKIKAYEIYEVISQFVSEYSMEKMINPLKTIMLETSDHKTMRKIEKAFHKIGSGLVHNKHISIESLIRFLNDIFVRTLPKDEHHESIEDEEQGKRRKQVINDKIKSDSFIIPEKSLRRVNQISKLNRLSHSHILSCFALNCYLFVLKNNKSLRSEAYREIMDQTLNYLKAFLKSNDLNVISLALNCILLLLTKFATFLSFESQSEPIISQIFFLLQKHSGSQNQENIQLTTLCFKTVAHFINIHPECKLSDQQISILLSYAEYDIENNTQNVAIYFLLKSIISRKFISKGLHSLMERLITLAITTDIDHVREHAIDLSIKYLTDYPIDPNRFKGKLLKLAKQLEVEWLAGRKAAITILKAVIQNLSYDSLIPLRDHLFIILSSSLINEVSPDCSRIIDETIRKLLSKLSQNDLDELFDTFIISWLTSGETLADSLSSKLCIMFLDLETNNFEKRLQSCLPIISEQLKPERFKSLSVEFNKNDDLIKIEDNVLFSHLNFIFKIFKMENILQIIVKKKFKTYLDDILENITSFLLHPHTWIRYVCVQIFGQIFSLFDPEVFSPGNTSNIKDFYLFKTPKEKMIQLSRKFCLIFRDIYACNNMSEQLIKNLVYIARVFIVMDIEEQNAQDGLENSNNTAEEKEEIHEKSLLEWLVKKLLFETKFEIKYKPNETKKRILFVKWIAAVSLKLGHENIHKYLPYFLPPLCRENISSFDNPSSSSSTKESGNDELKNVTKQVLQMIRNMVGDEKYIDAYNHIRNQISHQRLERRKKRAQQMVTNMVAGVKRKQRKHKRAQQSKKRKLIGSFKVSTV